MRVTKRTHADLSGEGAKLYGGRWNSPGRAVIYAASCGALAALEYRVHVKTPPTNLLLIRIEVPDTLPLEEIPSVPADPNVLFQLGNEWLSQFSGVYREAEGQAGVGWRNAICPLVRSAKPPYLRLSSGGTDARGNRRGLSGARKNGGEIVAAVPPHGFGRCQTA